MSVSGIIRERPEGTINDQMKTGAVELLVESGEVLNSSKTPHFIMMKQPMKIFALNTDTSISGEKRCQRILKSDMRSQGHLEII